MDCFKILKSWKISAAMLSKFYGNISPYNLEVKPGYSEPSLSLIKRGKLPDRSRDFLDSLRDTFRYDFETKADLDEAHRKLVVSFILNNYRPAKTDIILKVDTSIALNFEGLYLGFVSRADNVVQPPYILYVDKRGTVALKTHGKYYRTGVIASFNYRVYIYLNSSNSKEPELYITSIPEEYHNEQFSVAKFAMCGVWLDRAKKPSFGSTLLVKQLLEGAVIPSLEELGVELNDLKSLKNEFFLGLQENPKTTEHQRETSDKFLLKVDFISPELPFEVE